MQLSDCIKYVGRLKHPLQKPEVDFPSMYMLKDTNNTELCLIILTPGCYLHAYKFIKLSNPRSVKVFFPSLRPEFISDVMNLYMSLKNNLPIKWVFPESFDHYSFSMGHEKTGVYFHPLNKCMSIEYVENGYVEDVYDIIVRSKEGIHYFSFYMTDVKYKELFYCKAYDVIHVPKSSTIYGGYSYDELISIDPKYKKKLEPHDFTSIEDYYLYMGRDVPEIDIEEPKDEASCSNCEFSNKEGGNV